MYLEEVKFRRNYFWLYICNFLKTPEIKKIAVWCNNGVHQSPLTNREENQIMRSSPMIWSSITFARPTPIGNRQSGHVFCLKLSSHLSTQFIWNEWPHGSLRVASPHLICDKQTQHSLQSLLVSACGHSEAIGLLTGNTWHMKVAM